MTSFEDHFSAQAREYASFRPQYPAGLFTYLASISPSRQLAWDCGTGSGQAAHELARYFKRVVATDASADQIAQAAPHAQIDFRVERVEEVSLADHSVDLITAAQAVHWFDLDPFYEVVRRVSRPQGIIAVWVYNLAVISPAIDQLLGHYYTNVLAGFWPDRFHYLDEHYQTLPFPFTEIHPPNFEMHANWDLDQLAGYLDTWSATRRYQAEHGEHPLNTIWQALNDLWGEPAQRRDIRWPLYIRIGRLE